MDRQLKKSHEIMVRSLFSFLVSLLFIFLLAGCSSDTAVSRYLLTFDVSPDGNSIVFAAVNGEESSIYHMNIADKEIKILFDSRDSVSFFSPKFNENGDSIVFISSDFPKFLGTKIFIGDSDGKSSRVISDDLGLRTEVVFSKDESHLYYLQGGEYRNYSPLGRKSPHAFDIYQMDKNGGEINKISDYDAYSLSHFSLVSDSVLLFSSIMGGPRGLFFFNVNTHTNRIVEIENDSVGLHGSEYSNPVFVNDNTLLATMYYRLVSLDLKKKMEKTIFKAEGNHFSCVRYCKIRNKIFASIQGQNLIYILDMDGKISDTIEFNLDLSKKRKITNNVK